MRFILYRSFKQPGRLIFITSLLYLTAPGAYAGYLSDLEAEANSTDVQVEEDSGSTWSRTKQGATENLREGLTHEEFEQSLRDNYFGSSIFYEKLSDWNKKKVFETYQTTSDIEKIRNEIKTRMTK
jgi:hypothetical protein